MTEHGPDVADRARGDDRLRMDLYELLHERAESERKWQFWRLAAGHAVVGTILAYAVIAGNPRFVSLTPILYGIVVLDGLKTSVRMLYLQQHLVEVESKLAEGEPLCAWVSRYGVFGRDRRLVVWDVDLDSVPETAQYVLVLGIYLGLIAVSLVAWRPLADGGAGAGPRMTRSLLVVGYVTFTALLAAISAVGYLHYRRIRARIRDVRAASPE